MLFGKQDVSHTLEIVRSSGVLNLREILLDTVATCKSLDTRLLECQAREQSVPSLRRYGRGALLLGPFGYYHPSEICDIIADNVTRGRLQKVEAGSKYTYDYDANRRLIMIQFKCNATTTICLREGKFMILVTYRSSREGMHEIENITFVEFQECGLVNSMIEVSMFDNQSRIAEVSIEIYGEMHDHMRSCRRIDVLPMSEGTGNYSCFENAIDIVYGERKNAVSCVKHSCEKRSEISL